MRILGRSSLLSSVGPEEAMAAEPAWHVLGCEMQAGELG
jgi:hypothetical protein